METSDVLGRLDSYTDRGSEAKGDTRGLAGCDRASNPRSIAEGRTPLTRPARSSQAFPLSCCSPDA